MRGSLVVPRRRQHTEFLVALGLGSNLPPADVAPFKRTSVADPRVRALEGALVLLADRGWKLFAASAIRETAPSGVPGAQPDYLNACALFGVPDGSERAALATCEAVERAAGRRTKGDRRARPLDLDILAAWTPGGEDGARWAAIGPLDVGPLAIPHPRLHERAFALVPLAEIAGDLPVPTASGLVSVLALLERPEIEDDAQRTVPAPSFPCAGCS